jgi:hypothetical protein
MRFTTLTTGLAIVSALTACATQPATEPVPAALVPGAERSSARVPARGGLTYECRASDKDASRAAWVYVASDAVLFDAQGRVIGRHRAAPPVWEADDGSRIDGIVKARADAPRPGDAPWLLLTTRSTGGSGRLAGVTSLQRINTVGGVAPAGGCDGNALGKRTRVPFAADYVLFGS